jgi:5-methylcytosine-specific restriction protein A
MVLARTLKGGYVSPSELPKGPNGRALCRYCSKEVAGRRITFCSDACVMEWKVRSQPGYAKELVAKRDDGICEICRKDCFADLRNTPAFRYIRRRLRRFDMDHRIPVIEGGGSCGLENLRTLCRPCHRVVTAALAARRAFRRKSRKWFRISTEQSQLRPNHTSVGSRDLRL